MPPPKRGPSFSRRLMSLSRLRRSCDYCNGDKKGFQHDHALTRGVRSFSFVHEIRSRGAMRRGPHRPHRQHPPRGRPTAHPPGRHPLLARRPRSPPPPPPLPPPPPPPPPPNPPPHH